MGPLKNLLGGKKAGSGKDTKFSVKFDDAAQGKPAEPAAPAPAPVAAAAPAPAETTPATPPAPVSKAEAKKAKAEAAKKAKAEALQAKKALKAEKAAAKKGKTTAAVSTAAKAPEPEIVNFAPTYLNPANSLNVGRRRPGPSMNSFMTMARQVKVPKVTPKLPKAKK